MSVLFTERLAAIGQMIAGLAHESRNALQRIGACTEMLEFDLESNPSAMELLGRISKAQDDLRRLFDEVRGYASPITLEWQHCRLKSILDEAWDACDPLRVGRNAHLEVKSADLSDDELWVDRFRIVQVFRNILENSLAACPDPVVIEVSCQETTLDEKAFLEIRVTDNGPGVNLKDKARLLSHFSRPKPKGLDWEWQLHSELSNCTEAESASGIPRNRRGICHRPAKGVKMRAQRESRDRGRRTRYA